MLGILSLVEGQKCMVNSLGLVYNVKGARVYSLRSKV